MLYDANDAITRLAHKRTRQIQETANEAATDRSTAASPTEAGFRRLRSEVASTQHTHTHTHSHLVGKIRTTPHPTQSPPHSLEPAAPPPPPASSLSFTIRTSPLPLLSISLSPPSNFSSSPLLSNPLLSNMPQHRPSLPSTSKPPLFPPSPPSQPFLLSPSNSTTSTVNASSSSFSTSPPPPPTPPPPPPPPQPPTHHS